MKIIFGRSLQICCCLSQFLSECCRQHSYERPCAQELFFQVLGMEPRAWCLLNHCSDTEWHSGPHHVAGDCCLCSLPLFAELENLSAQSWTLVSKVLDWNHGKVHFRLELGPSLSFPSVEWVIACGWWSLMSVRESQWPSYGCAGSCVQNAWIPGTNITGCSKR